MNSERRVEYTKVFPVYVVPLFFALISVATFARAQTTGFKAESAEAKVLTLGSIDKKNGYKFQLELTSKGAAIEQATFSEYDDRNQDEPKPLVILSPVYRGEDNIVRSMANTNFVFEIFS